MNFSPLSIFTISALVSCIVSAPGGSWARYQKVPSDKTENVSIKDVINQKQIENREKFQQEYGQPPIGKGRVCIAYQTVTTGTLYPPIADFKKAIQYSTAYTTEYESFRVDSVALDKAGFELKAAGENALYYQKCLEYEDE